MPDPLPRFSPFDARDDGSALLLVRPIRRGEAMQRLVKRVAAATLALLGVLLGGLSLRLPTPADQAVGLALAAVCVGGAAAMLYWLGRFGVRGVRIDAGGVEILGTGFAGRAITRHVARDRCTGVRLVPVMLTTNRGPSPGWDIELQTSTGAMSLGRIIRPGQDPLAPGRAVAERLGLELSAPD